MYFGFWWVLGNIFWLSVGGGGWCQIYFGWWWVMVCGGGYILAGGRWWWIYFGWWWIYFCWLLVLSNKLQLKLPEVLRRVLLSLTNWGQWRRCSVDSTSFPQLHSAFNVSQKPCLNLCSLKGLKASLKSNKASSSRIMAIIKRV